MSLGRVLAGAEFWQTLLSPLIDRADRVLPGPKVTKVPGQAVRDPRDRFSREETIWMARRAGWRCECVDPECHAPEKGRTHARDGRCAAHLRGPGVSLQGDHLVPHSDSGATDPVRNGAALCGPCNQGKSDRDWSRFYARIAENRLAIRFAPERPSH